MARETVIQDPVINSPFEEPRRHCRFDDEGITSDIVDQRRGSCYLVPIAQRPGNGTGGSYDRLDRALRPQVDEPAWSVLFSTLTRALEKPETGRIPIKVINHYGDEVLKVYEVR